MIKVRRSVFSFLQTTTFSKKWSHDFSILISNLLVDTLDNLFINI